MNKKQGCKTCIKRDVCKYADAMAATLNAIRYGAASSAAVMLEWAVEKTGKTIGTNCKYYMRGGGK